MTKKLPKIKTKLHEFYIGERTTLTIENVAKTTLMTWDDWHKFDQEQQTKEIFLQRFYARGNY